MTSQRRATGSDSGQESEGRMSPIESSQLKPGSKVAEVYKQARAEVVDMVILEQFLKTFPDNVRGFVRERSPASSEEAAKLADDYLLARKEEAAGKGAGLSRSNGDKSGGGHCHRCGKVGYLVKDCQVPPQ